MSSKRDGHFESADLALAVYLEEVCDGRDVLWIGDHADAAADRLGRVARNVRVQRRVPELGDESVDVVVIPDLDHVGQTEPDAVARLARALGRDGALVAGTRARGGVGYEGLFALLSPEFRKVRMLGQSSFAGYTLVDFDASPEDQEAPTLDGSLVESDEAERYIALCADEGAGLDAYSVIRVPQTRRRRRRSAPPPPSEPDRAELEKAHTRSEALERDLAERTTELEGLRERLDEAAEAHEERVRDLAARLDAERDRVQELERALSKAADEASGREEEPAFDFDPQGEIARFESHLHGTGLALAEAERELERRAILVRDLVEELREAQNGKPLVFAPQAQPVAAVPVAAPAPAPLSAPAPAISAEEERRAVTRALEAEAARAEAQFTVDELMGELAASVEQIEELRAREAALVGRVRGLEARWAEADEIHELAAARHMLTEHDLASARGRIRSLEAELGETREQLELEMLKARGPSGQRQEETQTPVETPESGVRAAVGQDDELEALRASEKHLSERVSELSNQLMAAQDLADVASKAPGDAELREQLGAARELIRSLTEERDHARAENIRLTMMVGSLEDRFAGARRGYELRIAELVHDLSMAAEAGHAAVSAPVDEARIDALLGEVAGLRARLDDREAALSALSARPPQAATPATSEETDALRDEADRLRAQNAELKDRETDLTVRLADAEELSELEANRANDLASTVAARDALVNRLQLDLADTERRGRELEETADRHREEAERLREAVVDASERVGEVDHLSARIGELEEALKGAVTRAETHGGRMDAAEEVLRDARATLGELTEQLEEGGVSFGRTAMGIDAPDSGWNEPASAGPGRSQEVARLEARLQTMEREAEDWETLLRSLTAQLEERDERLRSGERGTPADRELRQSMVELQERAAKLSESLANERRARREAEATASGKRSEELEKLHDALGDWDAELLVLRGQVSSAERELKSFREAAAETRSGLEELLGAATAQGDPGTAERVGGLLRVLSRVT